MPDIRHADFNTFRSARETEATLDFQQFRKPSTTVQLLRDGRKNIIFKPHAFMFDHEIMSPVEYQKMSHHVAHVC